MFPYPYLTRLLGSLEASRMPDLDIPFFWGLREGTSTRKINEPGSKPQLGVGLGTLFQSSQSSPMIGYHRLIPESQLFTGKDLTVPIEQDNSNIRHFLARFRRRTKVVRPWKWWIC